MSSWTFTPYNFPHLLPQATLCLFYGQINKIVEIRKLLIQFCRKVSKKKLKASALSDHGMTIILCRSRASVKSEMKRNCHMERHPGHWGVGLGSEWAPAWTNVKQHFGQSTAGGWESFLWIESEKQDTKYFISIGVYLWSISDQASYNQDTLLPNKPLLPNVKHRPTFESQLSNHLFSRISLANFSSTYL